MARVLVIEDNPASLDLMCYLLKAFGHEPLRASDGLQGIEVARAEHPDLILCDIQLPGATGIQVCEELKRDPALHRIPLVAVTAYAMVGDREKLLAYGFDGYISKPINPETFLEMVTPYIKRRTEQQQSPPSTQAAPVATHRSSTKSLLRILVVDNSQVNINLSRSTLEPFGYSIVGANSVDDAMKILKTDRPALILSDLHMPRKDGFDFIQEVKNDPELRSIPFLFISSTVWGERERILGLSLGAVEFIIRPIEPQALVEQIESCLGKARTHQPEVINR